MSNCACNNCIATKRPPREEMTLLQGDADRELRAAIVGGVLVIDAYDRCGSEEWDRDPEYGVALDREGIDRLRDLLNRRADENAEIASLAALNDPTNATPSA